MTSKQLEKRRNYTTMSNFWALLKKGNTSSAAAALGNIGLAIIKGIAAAISGSGTMFASTMHTVADAVNQGFVFFGSVLAERKPTPKRLRTRRQSVLHGGCYRRHDHGL